MIISCEKCTNVFEVNERHLNSKGVTAICPHCDHKHQVKRVVVPYALDPEEDTEPYDIDEGESQSTDQKSELSYGADSYGEGKNPEMAYVLKDSNPNINMHGINGIVEEIKNKSYHMEKGSSDLKVRIFNRLLDINVIYILIAALLVVAVLVFVVI